jgi:hypothetical protein
MIEHAFLSEIENKLFIDYMETLLQDISILFTKHDEFSKDFGDLKNTSFSILEIFPSRLIGKNLLSSVLERVFHGLFKALFGNLIHTFSSRIIQKIKCLKLLISIRHITVCKHCSIELFKNEINLFVEL